MKIAVTLDARPGEYVGGSTIARQRKILGTKARGRAHPVVDHFMTVLSGAIKHHRPATADAAHPRFQHPQRKSRSNDSIDAIATRRQHPGADFGGFSRLRGDDTAFGDYCRLADLLGAAELVVHGVAFCCRSQSLNRKPLF